MSMMLAGAAAWRRSGGDIPFDPIAAAILAKLTSWWELSEPSGVRADSHGGNNMSVSGTAIPTAAGVRGAGDPAASFQGGTGGTLIATSSADLQVPSGGGDHCLFGWFYADSNSGSQGLWSKWNAVNSASLEYYARIEAGQVEMLNGGSAYRVAAVSAPSVSNWHFFVGWRDDTDGLVRVQVNNGGVSAAALSSNPAPGTIAVRVATSNGATHKFVGRLQRWGWVKDAILTPAERDWLYNGGSGRTYAEIVSAASP